MLDLATTGVNAFTPDALIRSGRVLPSRLGKDQPQNKTGRGEPRPVSSLTLSGSISA